ncbi:MAG TPA: VWA domain-containing protein [Polyangia bacterium]|nr:VWA domain-containing protein [Polyangia bacterium]
MWSSLLSDVVLGGLSAGATAGIAAAGALVLAGLYLLKLRRRRVLVSFSPLWTSQFGERRYQRWARRLRRWMSLLLQLVFLGLVVVAAADPRPAGSDRAGRDIVILVDRSASMSAVDEPGTRLGRARQAANELISGLGAGDRAMVISFASGVTAESGFETDGGRLRAATAAIGPSEEPGDLTRALAFAAAALRGRAHPTVVLMTDGGFPPDQRQQVAWTPAADGVSLAGIDVRQVLVGRRRNNVALLSFAARRSPGDATSVEAALVVQNFRATPSRVLVEITAGPDRIPVERVRLSLGPGERRRHLLSDVGAASPELEARLLPAEGGNADDLAVDDRAFALVPGLTRLKILRVGGANLFLDGALLSLGDSVAVRRLSAAAAEASRATWPSYDAVIFDSVAPTPAPTTGRFLYLDPQGPGSPMAVRGTLVEPVLSEVKRGHPLLRQLTLADVNIAEARRLVLEPGDVTVASSLGAPLMATRTRPGLRAVVVAFDVRRSDLPMRSAFPLLLANALGYLADKDTSETLSFATGRNAHVAVGASRQTMTVVDPAGGATTRTAFADSIDFPITRTGFYRIDSRLTVPANLSDAVESDTEPVKNLTLGGRALAPPDPPRKGPRRALWMMALVAAVALTLFEWCSYHRRWTV